jgi:hypothetical protein
MEEPIPERKDLFLTTLWVIYNEQAATIKTQVPRLQTIWKLNWESIGAQLPDIRRLPIDREKFFREIPFRLECIRTLEYAMVDGYFVIKAIFEALFKIYINKGELFYDFLDRDRTTVPFLIAEQLVGSLLQFIMMEPTVTPLGFIVIAKNKAIMKIKERTGIQILEDLQLNGFSTTISEIEHILTTLVDWGYLTQVQDPTTGGIAYRFVKDFTLSPPGQMIFNRKVKPLIEWTVELWRSLYNIRSIDTIIPDFYPQREFLVETVKHAATQGFLTAKNVIENIGDYYKLCMEHGLNPP